MAQHRVSLTCECLTLHDHDSVPGTTCTELGIKHGDKSHEDMSNSWTEHCQGRSPGRSQVLAKAAGATSMNLEMRRRCEKCTAALQSDGEAYICSFECTFCP